MGAHPKILENLIKSNMEYEKGYGNDHYTKSAAEKIREVCGAPEADVRFLVGGTKVGALCGEAVAFTHNNTPGHFLTTIKQNGALLAKGRLLRVQFDTLFTDGLYFEISKNAIEKALSDHSFFNSLIY